MWILRGLPKLLYAQAQSTIWEKIQETWFTL